MIRTWGDPKLSVAHGGARLALRAQQRTDSGEPAGVVGAPGLTEVAAEEHTSTFPAAPWMSPLPVEPPPAAQGYWDQSYDNQNYGNQGYAHQGYAHQRYEQAAIYEHGYRPDYGSNQPPASPPNHGNSNYGQQYGQGYGEVYADQTVVRPPGPGDPRTDRNRNIAIALIAAIVVVLVAGTAVILMAPGKLFGDRNDGTSQASVPNRGSDDGDSGSDGSDGSDGEGTGSGTGGDQNAPDVDPANSANLADQASPSTEYTSDDGEDRAGNAISYAISNTLDGDLETTWRANGDASGQTLRYGFDDPVVVTSLGMTNGYPKRDPISGDDRYTEERRVTAVTWRFSDGTSVSQDLTDGERGIQSIDITPISTTSVELTIDSTTEPGDSNHDVTPISEVAIRGQ